MLNNKKIIAIVLGISIIGGIAYSMSSNKSDQKTNTTSEMTTTTSTSTEEGLQQDTDHMEHNHGEGESCAGNELLNSSGID